MENETEKPLLEFPVNHFPIKVMGVCTDTFAQEICDLVARMDKDFDPSQVEMRPSRTGKYLGVTVFVSAQTREALDAIYRALTGHPSVKVVL